MLTRFEMTSFDSSRADEAFATETITWLLWRLLQAVVGMMMMMMTTKVVLIGSGVDTARSVLF
jgi:hypothetical protein